MAHQDRCHRACPSKRKSVARAKIEDGFADTLRRPQLSRDPFDPAKAMFKDASTMRLTEAESTKRASETQYKDA